MCTCVLCVHGLCVCAFAVSRKPEELVVSPGAGVAGHVGHPVWVLQACRRQRRALMDGLSGALWVSGDHSCVPEEGLVYLLSLTTSFF